MAIRINSYKNSDVVHCSLPLIEGEVAGVLDGELTVRNGTSDSEHIVWPVINGYFKFLVSLVPGENVIVLHCDSRTAELALTYSPLRRKKFVRLVYIVCEDDCGSFQSLPGEKNSVQSAVCRIRLAAQMLQTFTSEKIKSHRLEAKTFCLEEDNGVPVVHVFKTSLCLEKARSMSENELWEHFALELMRSDLREGDDCKFLAIMSFTKYVNNSLRQPKSFSESKSMVQGYAALAAGGLALLGSACLHTWPHSLSEVPWRFGDTRKIDQLHLMDDSCNRGWHWACYATSLGATLHELGHLFDLGHTKEGIMSRGFDNIHRFFIVDLFYCSRMYQKKHNPHYQKSCHEKQHNVHVQKSRISWSVSKPAKIAEHKLQQKPIKHKTEKSGGTCRSSTVLGQKAPKTKPPWRIPFPPEAQSCDSLGIDAFWARSSALILFYHKWFNNEPDTKRTEKVTRNGTNFTSPHGISVVEYRDDDGMAFHHLEFIGECCPQEIDVQVALEDLAVPDTPNLKVHVQDSLGNISQHAFEKSVFLYSNK